MRFLIQGAMDAEVRAALTRHEHVCHTVEELLADADVPEGAQNDPAALLGLLGRKQWQLVTTDGALVRAVYERKLAFEGIIVMILEDPDGPGGQNRGQAIDRLFERYKRLTAGRLYTVTPNRVKIRQLPGVNG